MDIESRRWPGNCSNVFQVWLSALLNEISQIWVTSCFLWASATQLLLFSFHRVWLNMTVQVPRCPSHNTMRAMRLRSHSASSLAVSEKCQSVCWSLKVSVTDLGWQNTLHFTSTKRKGLHFLLSFPVRLELQSSSCVKMNSHTYQASWIFILLQKDKDISTYQ